MKKIKIPKLRISRLNISLSTFITVMVTILCGIMLFSYTFISRKIYYSKCEKQIINDIKGQCDVFAGELQENDFLIDKDSGIDRSVDTAADLLCARIIIVNNEYRIVKDSFGENNYSFVINEDVIRVMTGEKDELISIQDGFIHYVMPVYCGDEIQGVILVNASFHNVKDTTSIQVLGKYSIAGIIMIICMAGAFFIGYASVRGIKRINKQVENIRLGHLDDKLPLEGFKEFRTLTNSYNNTMDRLMVIDSTRQEFVSNVSHELKTPITSMKVLADSLVQNEDADLEMYKEFMTDIIEEIDRESKIITDLLTLVKTDRKDADMNIEEISINNLLEVILKRVSPIAQARGIEITYESYRDVVAEVDEVKLSLALSNIIENAVKYNVDNGWVKVTLNADHKNFHVKVADSGVGIPDDCKEHVFERFYRVDKARSRDTGGTGLGLSITRNVIRMHNGSIKLYSESGEGTTFTIKIPIKRVEKEN